MKKFIQKLKNFWYMLTDRCKYCGGKTWDWDWNKTYCHDCEKQQ